MTASYTTGRELPTKEVALVRHTRLVGNKAQFSVVAGRPRADRRLDTRRLRIVVDELIDAGNGERPF